MSEQKAETAQRVKFPRRVGNATVPMEDIDPPADESGYTDADPYDEPVWIQGHSHSEPICAWPDCQTYLTRPIMADLQAFQRRVNRLTTPPGSTGGGS